MKSRNSNRQITKVLLVEDHILVRESLILWLKGLADFRVEGVASSIDEARTSLETRDIDIVLLDLGLGDEDCLHEIAGWKKAYPGVDFLVLSASRSFLIAQRAMENGAVGFISKSDSPDDLVKGLESARAGKPFLSKSFSSRPGREPSADVSLLTARERDILRELASGKPNREIALRLGISTKTVERHRENIKHKLGLANGSGLICEAVRLFPSEFH